MAAIGDYYIARAEGLWGSVGVSIWHMPPFQSREPPKACLSGDRKSLTSVRRQGTSLSAPIWASIITLVNEERIAIGKKPVGFLNPTLVSLNVVHHTPGT